MWAERFRRRKSKAPRPDPKRANQAAKAAADEAASKLSAKLQQEIEDQILEELMTPAVSTSLEPTIIPVSAPGPRLDQLNSLPTAAVQESPNFSPAAVSNQSSSSLSSLAPTPIMPKSVARPKPARSGPSLAKRFEDPKFIGAASVLTILVLIVGWVMMPESSAADIKAYQTLDGLFVELRETRIKDKDGKKLIPLGKKLETTAKEIASIMKKSADAEHPARQALLRASQTIPKIVNGGLGGESPSEKEALAQLEYAAVCLGLKEAPPPAIADNTNNEP